MFDLQYMNIVLPFITKLKREKKYKISKRLKHAEVNEELKIEISELQNLNHKKIIKQNSSFKNNYKKIEKEIIIIGITENIKSKEISKRLKISETKVSRVLNSLIKKGDFYSNATTNSRKKFPKKAIIESSLGEIYNEKGYLAINNDELVNNLKSRIPALTNFSSYTILRKAKGMFKLKQIKYKNLPAKISRLSTLKSFICFGIKLLKLIEDKEALFFIDETSIQGKNFKKTLLGNQKWFPILRHAKDNYSINIIACLGLNGLETIGLKKYGYCQTGFVDFMMKTIIELRRNKLFKCKVLYFVLDNCPCHKSKEFLSNLEYLGVRLIFIIPKMSDLNLIEGYFAYLKSDFKNNHTTGQISILKSLTEQISKEPETIIKNLVEKFKNELIRAFNAI